MMRFREHRGGLAESMETTFKFYTLEDLMSHLVGVRPDIIVSGSVVSAAPYCDDDDPNWVEERSHRHG